MLVRTNELIKTQYLPKRMRLPVIAIFCILVLIVGFSQQFPEFSGRLKGKISLAGAGNLAAKFIDSLEKQGFSRQFIILEGMPYLSMANNELVYTTRNRALTLSFYLLTRVDITDPRTFFALQLPVPGVDPLSQGAYNPADPEQEGPIIEVVEEPTPKPVPQPSGPARVAIYSTHSSESYSGDGGADHELGKNGEIAQVAAALKAGLQKDGVPTVYSDTIHDYPSLPLAYSKSVKTATELIRSNPKLQAILDIHRDGQPAGKTKRTVNIKGKPAAPVMIVLGTKHLGWEKNEQFAKELIARGNAKYPGLFLPLYYASDARYNQQLQSHALLLEFGDQYNTTQEAQNSAEAVADVLTEILK